jgi:SsrA-binding protein
MPDTERRLAVSNRKARHDYEILETIEAGIVLTGTEVKSLRQGRANLQDAYALISRGEVVLHGAHISPYTEGSYANHDPVRPRKLLLQGKQIRKLIGRVAEKGHTLIPLSFYFKGPYVKVELALARGKRQFDKRETIKKRDAEREIQQRMKQRTR